MRWHCMPLHCIRVPSRNDLSDRQTGHGDIRNSFREQEWKCFNWLFGGSHTFTHSFVAHSVFGLLHMDGRLRLQRIWQLKIPRDRKLDRPAAAHHFLKCSILSIEKWKISCLAACHKFNDSDCPFAIHPSMRLPVMQWNRHCKTVEPTKIQLQFPQWQWFPFFWVPLFNWKVAEINYVRIVLK